MARGGLAGVTMRTAGLLIVDCSFLFGVCVDDAADVAIGQVEDDFATVG